MSDNKKFFSEERILSAGGFIILTAAAVISFLIEAEHKTILPFPEISVPAINTASAIAALIYFIFPHFKWLAYGIMLIQGISTMITGYETLGIFLFTALGIFSFCNGDLRTNFKLKISLFLTTWFASLFGILPFGIARFILSLAESVLFITFYFCIYKKLAKLLAPISPVLDAITDIKINLPEPGKTIYLCDYDLNERQQKFIYDNIKFKSNYHDLSEKYYVSPSTVKKEMVNAFNKIGVKNLEELRLLFMQYEVELDRKGSNTDIIP